MRTSQRNRIAVVWVVALSLVTVFAACSSDSPTPTPTTSASPALPPPFPYIFSGRFIVDGELGPQGLPVFARLGDGRGPFNNTVRPGEYTNVSVAGQSTADNGKVITFHLGLPDGPTVQAAETYIFNVTSQPQFITLDLNFPRLP